MQLGIRRPIVYASGSFPATSVLDTFNRADGGPGANWTSPVFIDTGLFTIASNQASLAISQGGFWNPTTFGPDCEVFGTFVSGASSTMRLFLRANNTGSHLNGYFFQFNTVSSIANIFISSNGVTTKLGADISWNPVTQVLGGKAVGSTLILYGVNSSSSGTTQLGVRTDTTWSTAGNIGWAQASSVTSLCDSFGGGNL